MPVSYVHEQIKCLNLQNILLKSLTILRACSVDNLSTSDPRLLVSLSHLLTPLPPPLQSSDWPDVTLLHVQSNLNPICQTFSEQRSHQLSRSKLIFAPCKIWKGLHKKWIGGRAFQFVGTSLGIRPSREGWGHPEMIQQFVFSFIDGTFRFLSHFISQKVN